MSFGDSHEHPLSSSNVFLEHSDGHPFSNFPKEIVCAVFTLDLITFFSNVPFRNLLDAAFSEPIFLVTLGTSFQPSQSFGKIVRLNVKSSTSINTIALKF
jgi:hypothetical protein